MDGQRRPGIEALHIFPEKLLRRAAVLALLAVPTLLSRSRRGSAL